MSCRLFNSIKANGIYFVLGESSDRAIKKGTERKGREEREKKEREKGRKEKGPSAAANRKPPPHGVIRCHNYLHMPNYDIAMSNRRRSR
jgi:hypothetical protein